MNPEKALPTKLSQDVFNVKISSMLVWSESEINIIALYLYVCFLFYTSVSFGIWVCSGKYEVPVGKAPIRDPHFRAV